MLESGFYNMDCMLAMKAFPDKFFDLAVVDPQYGINAPKMNMGQTKIGKEKASIRVRARLSAYEKGG